MIGGLIPPMDHPLIIYTETEPYMHRNAAIKTSCETEDSVKALRLARIELQ